MEIAALVLAVLALALAVAALSRASGALHRLEEAGLEERRREANAVGQVAEDLERLTRQVALLAGGEAVTPQMIVEKRLWREVSPEEARGLLERGEVRVLDVRSPAETAAGVLPGALHIPVEDLEARVDELPRDGRRTLVYCAMGMRSAYACDFLARQGFDGLLNLEGGIGAWSGPLEQAGTH